MSAIRLMRREAGYWREIASEKIDGPDIEERLSAMIGAVDPSDPVHIFLPRDQILYTDVAVSGEDSAAGEIRAAMEGRTPYALDELDLDWEITESGTARVAAIALETLDEALAFAEQRGLKVAELSSFAEPEDFPRLPDFGGLLPLEDQPQRDDAAAVTATATFVSTREPAAPQAAQAPSRTESDPVVIVDDATPVMQVEQTPPVPLVAPLPRRTSEPRILTDIAARPEDRARGDSLAPIAAGAAQPVSRKGLAIAAALTLAIGAVVWAVLPDRAEEAVDLPSATEAPSIAETPAAPIVEDQDTARAEASAAPADPLADAPQPEPLADIASLPALPEDGARPDRPAALRTPVRSEPDALADFAAPDAARPSIQQLLPTPEDLAAAAALEPGLDSAGGIDASETLDDLYVAGTELPDLATDAIALPEAESLAADSALPNPAPPAQGEVAQDDTPSATDAAVLAALDPAIDTDDTAESEASEPSPEPETTEAEAPETAPEDTDPASALPAPTALAAALPDERPRSRPGGFTQEIERDKYGGRTLAELETIRPSTRPESAQALALAARAEAATPGNAVETSALPRGRPQDFDALVATAILRQQQSRQQASADFETPDTSAAVQAALAEELEDEAEEATRPQNSPRLAIPPASSANVARQATVEDAIRLNRINLVGVYGVPSDRRALIRLPSGRYIKVKVGDRVDGGQVSAISESELRYQKGSRTFALTMPSG